MKLKVIQENGAEETLTLTGSWRVHEGKTFNCLIGPGGFMHFFTQSGEYEGWGNRIFRSPERAGAISEADAAHQLRPDSVRH
jgi:hypothetical protein